jgi:O-acetyl-ADP-ribose deacetylase (regulator of RNase III)
MLELVRADITTLEIDAIVNAADEALRGGGGVDGAIHRAAGPELLAECRLHPGCPTGDAVLTAGYRLPARFVIHTVGPIWHGGTSGEPALLRRAYESVLRVARDEGTIRSIAFPALSTGIFAYPREAAAHIALDVLLASESEFDRLILCLFDDESFAVCERALPIARERRMQRE